MFTSIMTNGWASTPLSRCLLASVTLILARGCQTHPNAVFTELTVARRAAADLRVQFSKASDASNRAVMADSDEAAATFAHEAVKIRAGIESEVGLLGPRLRNLGYTSELAALDAFAKQFGEYQKLDREILELAIDNTNLKAQRLSFGPARDAADTLQNVLQTLAAGIASKDRCRVELLATAAILAVRQIQVLQAPHIAEPTDAVMGHLENEMNTLYTTATNALKEIAGAVKPTARSQLTTAEAALERFNVISTEIVKLSRRNSGVRSLALALRRKPAITAGCDNSLLALQDSLAKESFSATR